MKNKFADTAKAVNKMFCKQTSNLPDENLISICASILTNQGFALSGLRTDIMT